MIKVSGCETGQYVYVGVHTGCCLISCVYKFVVYCCSMICVSFVSQSSTEFDTEVHGVLSL